LENLLTINITRIKW